MLGVMLNVHKKIADRKGWLGICGLKKDLHKVFRLTKLDKVFNFYDDQDAALRAVEI
jgi:anti-anti-sigma regulatory factor